MKQSILDTFFKNLMDCNHEQQNELLNLTYVTSQHRSLKLCVLSLWDESQPESQWSVLFRNMKLTNTSPPICSKLVSFNTLAAVGSWLVIAVCIAATYFWLL